MKDQQKNIQKMKEDDDTKLNEFEDWVQTQLDNELFKKQFIEGIPSYKTVIGMDLAKEGSDFTAILIRGNLPIKSGKITNISFEDDARDFRDNTITVHVDQEVTNNDLFDALIPYLKSIDLKTSEIRFLLPAHFKINIAEIMKWFCYGIKLEDTTDNILDKNQPKLFIGIVRNADVLKILFDKYTKYNDSSVSTNNI